MPLSKRELRDQSGSYIPRLVALLYAVFDPVAGPKIVHQVPEGSVATALTTFPTTTQSSTKAPLASGEEDDSNIRSASGHPVNSTQVLFDFSSILDFIIPKPELCGHLITTATRTSKILGFPVRIYDENKYHKGQPLYNRNVFIFNVSFVFERDAELSSFEPVVRKTGRTLKTMEESVSLLSSPPPDFDVANLLEQIYMDINTFSETSIPLHDTDLDLMLFPFYTNPPEIKHWDVPIAVAALTEMRNSSWDVTLFKVCSFINGVNHVRRIAELAEVDLNLARLCIQHLLYHSAVILVDMFQFSNSYTALPSIVEIPQYGEEEDEGLVDLRTECENYVYSGSGDVALTPFAKLLELYAKLRPGFSVSAWMDAYQIDDLPIDPRRMIQFGVIKGFLRRVYAYPVWLDHPAFLRKQSERDKVEEYARNVNASVAGYPSGSVDQVRDTPQSQRPSASHQARPDLDRNPSSSIFSTVTESSVNTVPHTPLAVDAPAKPQERTAVLATKFMDPPITAPPPSFPTSLPLLMNGSHHTDEICLRYGITLKHLETVLRAVGGADQESTSSAAADEGGRSGTMPFGSRVVVLYV